jgi:hypothetical protein
MKDLNNQKFEESWRKALADGEIDPSSSVWSNIELDLMQAEGNTMKKKVVFYKWVAAASVFLVVFLGGAFYYSTQTSDKQIATTSKPNEEISSQKNNVKPENDQGNLAISGDEDESRQTKEERKQINEDGKPTEVDAKLSLATVLDVPKESFAAQEEKPIVVANSSRLRSEQIAVINLFEEVPAIVHGKIVLPRLGLPAMPSAFMNSSKKNKQSEDLWASVGFAAGSYNPGSTSSNSSFQASPLATSVADLNKVGYSDPSSVGTAYSAGFAMSKRVFSRWVLQGGVNYISQSIGYTSNYVSSSTNNQSKAFVAEYANASSLAVTITNPYEINSEINVVSLPIQTGYLIVDKKIGWQMNTGVAADFFVKNTLTDESGNLDRFSQGSGEDSPYRAVSWAGLLGTELSYKVAKQYRVSVVPSMRYSLNSVLKSTTANSSNPLVMDIGFRFRYIFK